MTINRKTAKPIALYLLLLAWSVVLTWPLGLHFSSHLPLGTESAATVPQFNLWTLQWNTDQTLRGWANYWQAPIFAPAEGSFAFSELQPLAAWLALPLTLNFGAVVGYNSLLLIYLSLLGWFNMALLRRWGLSLPAAVMGGLLSQSLPFFSRELGVLQLIAWFGVSWTLYFLHRLLTETRPSAASALGVGFGVAVTFFTCSYYGLFGALVWAVAGLFFWLTGDFSANTWPRRVKSLALLLVGLSLSLLMLGPFLWPQRQILQDYGFTRSEATVRQNSARLLDYTRPPAENWLYGGLVAESSSGQRLFWGFGLSLWAMGGLLGSRLPGRGVLAVTAGLAFLLSLGLNFELFGWHPFASLRAWVPGLAELRSPFRWAVVVQMSVALLAVYGFDAFWRASRSWGRGAAILLLALTFGELLSPPQPLVAVSNPPSQPSAWQSWLISQGDSVQVVYLPFAEGRGVQAFEPTTRWMLDHRPLNQHAAMLNGYSGYFPRWHAEVRRELAQFPLGESMALLQDFETDYVIIFHQHPHAPPRRQVSQRLTLHFWDSAGEVGVYAGPP